MKNLVNDGDDAIYDEIQNDEVLWERYRALAYVGDWVTIKDVVEVNFIFTNVQMKRMKELYEEDINSPSGP